MYSGRRDHLCGWAVHNSLFASAPGNIRPRSNPKLRSVPIEVLTQLPEYTDDQANRSERSEDRDRLEVSRAVRCAVRGAPSAALGRRGGTDRLRSQLVAAAPWRLVQSASLAFGRR